MNIVTCIMFIFAGILAIKFLRIPRTQGLNDYSECSTASRTVLHTPDFGRERWVVRFKDKFGTEVLRMDDIIAASSFSHKYKRSVSDSAEEVYYYPLSDNCLYKINNQKVEYYIHFATWNCMNCKKSCRKRLYYRAYSWYHIYDMRVTDINMMPGLKGHASHACMKMHDLEAHKT